MILPTLALAFLALSSSVADPSMNPPSDGPNEARVMSRSGPVSLVRFFGWSPDSSRVGWSLTRRNGAGKHKKTYYVREIRRTNHGKARLWRLDLADAKFPPYFFQQKFEIHDIEVSASQKRDIAVIPLRYGRRLVLELKTEDRIHLYYWFEEGDDRVLLHKASFDEIYFAFDAWAWLSPNGRSVALALALDGDIRLDAALVVLVLPVAGWQKEVK